MHEGSRPFLGNTTTWADPGNVFVSITAAVMRKAYNGAEIVPEQAFTVL
jgi:hypothetical protein